MWLKLLFQKNIPKKTLPFHLLVVLKPGKSYKNGTSSYVKIFTGQRIQRVSLSIGIYVFH
jgi:hypothetical protein